MSTEQKILTVLGAICFVVFVGAFIVMASRIHPIAGAASIALSAWWIGGAVAEVLREHKDKTK